MEFLRDIEEKLADAFKRQNAAPSELDKLKTGLEIERLFMTRDLLIERAVMKLAHEPASQVGPQAMRQGQQ